MIRKYGGDFRSRPFLLTGVNFRYEGIDQPFSERRPSPSRGGDKASSASAWLPRGGGLRLHTLFLIFTNPKSRRALSRAWLGLPSVKCGGVSGGQRAEVSIASECGITAGLVPISFQKPVTCWAIDPVVTKADPARQRLHARCGIALEPSRPLAEP
jgi:hypothetical protein